MAVWGISPIEIVETWTDELLALMLRKLVERKEAERRAIDEARESAGDYGRGGRSGRDGRSRESVRGRMRLDQLMHLMGRSPRKVVRQHD